MISTFIHRIVQGVGWIALLGAHGVVVGTIVAQSLGGPGDFVALMPSAGMARTLFHSFCIAGGASMLAVAVGAVVACAAAQTRRRAWRTLLFAFMLLAILTMPSIHAYAWQLLFTSQAPAVGMLNDALIAAGPWGARCMSAIVLGMWLWPIPAYVVLDGLQRDGAQAMELTLLDAGPFRAFFRGVIPLLRGRIFAAAAIVFVAAALDATVAPLMLASDVWPVEMLRAAEAAKISARPAGQMFWRSWPMLTAIGLLALIAIPGLRRVIANRRFEAGDHRVRRFGGRWLIASAIAAASISALLPVVVFLAMLSTDERYSLSSAIQSVWRTAQGPATATAIVAILTATLSYAMAVACELGMRARDSALRNAGRLILGLTIVTAVLPTALLGTSIVSFYASPALGSASGWNLYDDTPVTWIAAVLARFAFVPVMMIVIAGWSAPRILLDLAEMDTSGIRAWRFGRWPLVRGAAMTGACVAGLLAFTEVQASALAKAPRWGDDSLAVFLDSQMHYGRHGQTLALALLMYIPVAFVCVIAAADGWTRERFKRVTR